MEHTIKSEGLKLSCSCGWKGTVVNPKFTEAVSARHILQKKEWPYKKGKKPGNFTPTTRKFS